MTPPSTAGAKPKPVTTVPIRPALQKPEDTANAMGQAERLALQSDLAWVGQYNGAITGDVSERMVNAIKEFQKSRGGKQTGVLNPQERGILADTARKKQESVGWKIVTDPGTGVRLGIPDQAGAAAGQRRQRHQMDVADRHDPDSTGAAQGSRPRHGKARRAREEGAGAQHRLHRGQAGLLRAVRPAGPEEILSARHLQGRRGPHPHHPLRSGDREYRGTGRDRDVERVQCVSGACANGRASAAQDRGIRHRRRRQRRRRDHCRPPDHRRLPHGRDRGLWQCRPRRRGQGARSRAAAHLWRARAESAQSRQRRHQDGARPHRHCRSAEPGRRRRGDQRQGFGRPAWRRQRYRADARAGARLFRRARAGWRRQVRRHRAVEAGSGGRAGQWRTGGAGGAGDRRYGARFPQGQWRQCGRWIDRTRRRPWFA